jgi:hypothetical protein
MSNAKYFTPNGWSLNTWCLLGSRPVQQLIPAVWIRCFPEDTTFVFGLGMRNTRDISAEQTMFDVMVCMLYG